MQYVRYLVLLLIFALGVSACTPEANETPTPAPTQTPFVVVVTATASQTPVPSRTPVATATASMTPLPPTPNILDRCVLRTDWESYEVQAGDTLSNISVRTNSTVTTLQLANCIPNVNRITVGQTLYVPELPDENEVIVEDIISNFNVNLSEAEAGDTIIFTWTAETGTVIAIKNVTGNTLVGSNLAATGSLSYTLASNLAVGTELEFAITGLKQEGNDEILASPYSAFVTIIEEPELTDEPDETEEPEVTEAPEATEESE